MRDGFGQPLERAASLVPAPLAGGSRSMGEEIKSCEHKWVHLIQLPTREIGYRRWMAVDLFYCERCLAQKEVEREIK